MKNGNIEDIYIGGDENRVKKRGKKGIIIIFIILILILTGMVSAYFYFTSKTKSPKQLFLNSFSNTNVKSFFENNIYEEISNRMLQESSESNTNVTFSNVHVSSAQEDEESDNFDISNFELNITNKNDIDNIKSFTELGVNYSGNDLFKARLIANENEIAIASDEIVNKYLGVHYDAMHDVFGIDLDKEKVKNIINEATDSQGIDLSNEEKSEYIKKYMTKLFETIPEEKFTAQDNIQISKSTGEQVDNVVSYTLELSQDELKGNLVRTLKDLKSDEELLGKLIIAEDEEQSEEDEENTVANEETEENVIPLETNSVINIREPEDGDTAEPAEESNFNSSLELNVNEEDLDDLNNLTSDLNLDAEEENTEDNSEEFTLLTRVLLGIKVDATISELQDEIDTLIGKINSSNGSGLKITVYTSEKSTEKITIILPDESNLDFEFTTNESNPKDNTIQISYIYTGELGIEYLDDETITYSAEDDISDSDVDETSTNGFTLLLNKVDNDANTKLKATLSLVENEEINYKYDIDITTTGTATSKTFENDIIIGANTDESKGQIIIDNKIDFGTTPEIDDLTDENCLFLDTLSEEERAQTLEEIFLKIMTVSAEKQEDLNLIDSNSGTSFIESNKQQNPALDANKEEAKKALIDRVSKMMGQAQNNGEEFTIKDLDGLTLDGYEVSTEIKNDAAIIDVDIYTFKIDKNFVLTEE